jgi:hypothetical protein
MRIAMSAAHFQECALVRSQAQAGMGRAPGRTCIIHGWWLERNGGTIDDGDPSTTARSTHHDADCCQIAPHDQPPVPQRLRMAQPYEHATQGAQHRSTCSKCQTTAVIGVRQGQDVDIMSRDKKDEPLSLLQPHCRHPDQPAYTCNPVGMASIITTYQQHSMLQTSDHG